MLLPQSSQSGECSTFTCVVSDTTATIAKIIVLSTGLLFLLDRHAHFKNQLVLHLVKAFTKENLQFPCNNMTK
ncbi:hypothetical protein AFLA_013443 [Aspergillus flavus NRRL3357]|nr:hypothetical protein AFLA_013443 [Aspergillus flavus NRRL3357]